MIFGISEEIFWQCDLSFLLSLEANYSAYEGWLSRVREEYRDGK